MEADMATAWQTVEEAALTLGISSRTLHRRIARNEVETRLEHGRREVLVTLSDPAPTSVATATDIPTFQISDPIAEAFPAVEPSTDMSDGSDAVGQTMLALLEDRIRRTDLAIMAYQQSVTNAAREARRSRIGSRWAWATASAALITLCLGATWATHRLTRAEAQVETLNSTLQTVSSEAQTKAIEANKYREQAETARIAAAKVEGELSATKSQLQAVKTAPPVEAPIIKLVDPMKLAVSDK
jgi:hypothetical protein